MENQNTSNKGNQAGQAQDNSQPRANNFNNRPQDNRSRFNNQKNPQERNQNNERNRSNDRSQTAERSPAAQDERSRSQNDQKYAQRNKERRGFDRTKENNQPAKYPQNLSGPSHSNNQTHFSRNSVQSTIRSDITSRQIKQKRVETVEDIQADIERVEKDIQLEIKQIRAAKLGL